MVKLTQELFNRQVIKSMAEGRRLISMKAVKVNNELVDEDKEIDEESIIKVGRKIIVKKSD